jgi:6-phosphogluconolactonase
VRTELHAHADAASLAQAASQAIVRAIEAGLARHSSFTLVLAGGNTPRRTYELLAESRTRVAWDRVHVFWGDERCVAPTDPESNYGAAKAALLDRVAIPPENVHRIRGELAPDAAADAYEVELRDFFGMNALPEFDLVLLGMGADGHTASLFPNTEAVTETQKLVVAYHVPVLGRNRMSITFPLINAARNVILFVTGSDKADAVAKLLGGDPAARAELPVSRVNPEHGNFKIILDGAAARAANLKFQ